LAIVKRPAYVTKQKEQQRLARMTERRTARLNRKHATETDPEDLDSLGPPAEDMPTDEEAGD
jgi:hypothetical protein